MKEKLKKKILVSNFIDIYKHHGSINNNNSHTNWSFLHCCTEKPQKQGYPAQSLHTR
jgi:hypothetical protein